MVPHAARTRRMVLDAIQAQGEYGATLEEISFITALSLQCVCGRRRELDISGLIRNTGRTRKTTSGRRAAVWVLR